METSREKKYRTMTEAPLEKLLWKLAVPTIIAMTVTAAYNMADTFFVGRIGTEATAGVGLILPVMTIIQAFGFFFGQGSGNYIARALGAKENEHAEKMAATGGIFAGLFGLLFMAAGLVFRNGLLTLLGAREGLVDSETITCATEYLIPILLGAPFMCLSCVLNNQLRFQGNAVFAMVGLVSGAILNCVLDPLFIFALKLDVTGAALATMISQAASCLILYIGTLRSDNLKIRLKSFTPSPFYLKNICVGGLPSLCRQALSSLSTLCLNAAAGMAVAPELAEESIAAFSVVSKIMLLAYSMLLGFGQGFQPICGFNYGAKKYDRVWAGFMYCLKIGILFLIIMSVLGYAFAPELVAVFREDADVVAFGTVALRMQCITFTLLTLVTLANMMYQNMGRVWGASLLAAARQGLFFIPAVIILPRVLSESIWGVYLAQPVSDILAFSLALPMTVRVYKEFKKVNFGKDSNI